ncbi:Transcriptional regulator of nonfermentable carbon utilization [Mucor circinelloides]
MATKANSDLKNSNNMSPTSTTQQQKVPQRKKKAARACVHCQKAHLTCDDSRPCQRCIKRDLANTCTDGARKKAKYLQDADDNVSCTSSESRYTPAPSQQLMDTFNNGNSQQPSFLNGANLIDANQLLGLDNSNSTLNYGFGSNATNLEYSILSNMLGSPQFMDNAQSKSWSPNNTNTIHNDTHNTATSTSTTASTPAYTPNLVGDPILYSPQQHSDPATFAIAKIDQSPKSNLIITPPPSFKKNHYQQQQQQMQQQRMGYNNASKPFSYADGYHYLINYVRQKMGRDELMRISKALALFRPSVLASMMNLTEDDLIFTEKCLQRTLLEYEKLITYSGTPTVVWRRTGEIALVGKEFSLLTQWSRDAILSKKTYIYELMSDPSAVEYWEKYALHAFDNTDSAVYSSCILMSPTKRVVPCTFCFTIKRDIFDLPSVIVGNFLPILS